MFCKQQLSPIKSWFLQLELLLLVCLLLHGTTSPAQAQEELGFILESPATAVVPLGSVANFTCSAVGFVFWEVNEIQVQSSMFVDTFAAVDIHVPLSTENSSVVTAIATSVNNHSNLSCIVEPRAGDFQSLNESSVVQLIAYGEPSPPSQLIASVASRGIGVTLTWQPGFALEGEDVLFIVSSEEVSSGQRTQIRTDLSSAVLSPEVSGSICQTFNFTVHSENGFSRSSTAASQSVLLPAVPLPLDRVNVSVSFQPSVQVMFQFNAPSPCDTFSVNTYNVTFFEIANSLNENLQPAFTINRNSTESMVSLTLSDADGILSGRQYNFTIFASNIAGSSDFSGSLFTTGLQSAQVMLDSFMLHATCEFASGSDAVGCQVSLGSLLVLNVTRGPDMTVATGSVNISEDMFSEMVAVAEILVDGRVSFVNVQAIVNVSLPGTTMTANTPHPSDMETTTSQIQNLSTATTPFSLTTGTDESFLSGSNLYIIIGAIAAVIVLLLLIIIVVLCIIRSSYHKSKNTRAIELEELKPNYVYGERGAQPHLLTVSTDLGGLETTRQARSNTYDDPRSDLAASNGPSGPANPTYETVQSAKNGVSVAGGPPVLNPVYGPTGTPNTPTSPRPPPSKAAANPVYADSGLPPQLPDVSALNPVYAPIGKPEPSCKDAAASPRYATLHTNGVSSNTSKEAAPMYEELRATKLLPNTTGVQVTKNESYGVLGTESKETSCEHNNFNT